MSERVLEAFGCWLLAFGAAACSHWVTTTEEVPVGSCAATVQAESGKSAVLTAWLARREAAAGQHAPVHPRVR